MIYYCNFFIIFFCTLVTDIIPIKQTRRIKGIIFWMISFYLFLFVAFRVDTGFDINSYQNIYNEISGLNLRQFINYNYTNTIETTEFGYNFLNYLCKNISYQGFLVVVTVIAMIPKYLYIYKFFNRKILGLLIYYATIIIMFDMGVLRQSIAVAFCLWAYEYINEKKYVKAVFTIAIAAMFHSSVLIVLLIFLLKDKLLRKRSYYIIIFFALIISLLHPLNFIFRNVAFIGNNYIVKKVLYYALDYSAEGDTYEMILRSAAKRFVLFILFTYAIMRDKSIKNGGRIKIYYNAFFLSIVIALFTADVPIIAARGTQYFQVAQICLFEYLIERGNKITNNVVINRLAILAVCLILMLYSLSNIVNDSAYANYNNILLSQNIDICKIYV